MKKDVVITIQGTQTVGNESEEVELFTTGRFYKKDSQYYLAYEETEATGGFGGPIGSAAGGGKGCTPG